MKLIDIGVGALDSMVAAGIGAAASTLIRMADPDVRLSGRWEGDFTCSTHSYPTHVIHCVMVIARPSVRPNSGLLYYTRECSKEAKIIIRGMDELRKYSVKRRKLGCDISMSFVRRFQKNPDESIDYSESIYDFECICDTLLKINPSLNVKTHIRSPTTVDIWEGVLQKQ